MKKQSYDNVCKRILSQKSILARIMKACISEYKDISIDDIKTKYIEGEAHINVENVTPEDKYITDIITGINTEDSSINEGYITYDIKYKAILPVSNTTASLIINIEAQNDKNTDYSILKRAIFYASRMISSQKGTEFKNSDYDKINKVYSIWIFTSPFKKRPTTITEYKFHQHHLVGQRIEKVYNYDLIDIITIYLGEGDNEYLGSHNINPNLNNLISLMKTLFTNTDKRGTIKLTNELNSQFGINIDDKFREELDDMCNLSEGVYEAGRLKGIEEANSLSAGLYEAGRLKGIEEGISQGISQNNINIAKNMLADNLPLEEISKYTGLSINEINDII